MNSDLIRLRGQGVLDAIDLEFARFMDSLSVEASPPELLLTCALLSQAVSQGHVCLMLDQYADTLLEDNVTGLRTPSLEAWVNLLESAECVGKSGDFKPVILEGTRLYLFRYWQYETQLASQLLLRSGSTETAESDSDLQERIAKLFPANDSDPDQRSAVALSLTRRFCVISGGPGTGKTTTLARILAAVISNHHGADELRVAMAAPTGKAAARMQQAVRDAKRNLDGSLDNATIGAIPETASTLHRLLKSSPGSAYFKHNKKDPLAIDVLVLDEASMIDLPLMAKTVDALPPQARLIMLGDKDQLASVEAGSVLGDICAGASNPDNVASKQDLTAGSTISGSIALLKTSYRFDHTQGIGQLAASVNAGDAIQTINLLKHGDKRLSWSASASENEIDQRLKKGYQRYINAVKDKPAIHEVFDSFYQFGVLCGQRKGSFGTDTINRIMESRLNPVRDQIWYAGRAVMIVRNDYQLDLFNGDIGIALPDESGQIRVMIPRADGDVRSLPPARLPEHQTAFALTIHKSQGSEFERVLLLLPDADSRVLSRELLYTGITRAKQSLEILGNENAVRNAVNRKVLRASGLSERLWMGGVQSAKGSDETK